MYLAEIQSEIHEILYIFDLNANLVSSGKVNPLVSNGAALGSIKVNLVPSKFKDKAERVLTDLGQGSGGLLQGYITCLCKQKGWT